MALLELSVSSKFSSNAFLQLSHPTGLSATPTRQPYSQPLEAGLLPKPQKTPAADLQRLHGWFELTPARPWTLPFMTLLSSLRSTMTPLACQQLQLTVMCTSSSKRRPLGGQRLSVEERLESVRSTPLWPMRWRSGSWEVQQLDTLLFSMRVSWSHRAPHLYWLMYCSHWASSSCSSRVSWPHAAYWRMGREERWSGDYGMWWGWQHMDIELHRKPVGWCQGQELL